jgi:tRNA dimethylallyltransferase
MISEPAPPAGPEKTAIIVAGPTAVGKTAFSVGLAGRLGTEILSVDARQCYRELSIGVAKPSADELSAVPHHFIDSHSVTDNLNAAVFEAYALKAADDVFSRYDTLVVCGGSGLYLRAFLEGIDEMPEVPPHYVREAEALLSEGGREALAAALRSEDPLFAADGEMQNPGRMIRALSFRRATGLSIRSFQRRRVVERPFRTLLLGLDLPRAELHARIEARVDAMMSAGLLEEVRSLAAHRNLNALQTVGYRELFHHLDGALSIDEAVALIKRNTRRYARRQLTWFHATAGMEWYHPGRPEEVYERVEDFLGRLRT